MDCFNCQLKDAFRSRLAVLDWFLHLPWVLLGLRIAPKEATQVSSAELVYGTTLTVPGEFLGAPELPPEDFLRRLRLVLAQQPLIPAHNNTLTPSSVPDSLKRANFVLIRHDAHQPLLTPLYHGPYQVIERGPKTFRLKMGDKEEVVSVDRLKATFSEADPIPFSPPRRGRPRKIQPLPDPAFIQKRPRGRPRKKPVLCIS